MSLAVENSKPGVVALVNAGQVSRPLERQPSSTLFVVGFASWGPKSEARIVTSYNDFLRQYGGFHPLGYLAEAAKVFFDHFGGAQMIVSRAVGASAAKATVNLNNRVAVTPEQSVRVDALYPSLQVDLKVTVSDETDTTTVRLKVESTFLNQSEIFEGFKVTDAAIIAAVNAKSKLVKITKLSPTAIGTTARLAAGTFNLTGGTDDAASVTTSNLATYLTNFEDSNLGNGQVAIPGYTDSNDIASLIAHAQAYNRLAIIDSKLADAPADVVATATANRSSFAAIYYPWVQMVALDGSGVKKFYPPSIFAAGACAQVDRTIGTHKAPANIIVPLALDIERGSDGRQQVGDGNREYLNKNRVNAVAPIAGEGIKIYGARVNYPNGETRVRFVHERRLLSLIHYTAQVGYTWAVFAVVDGTGRLFRDLRSSGKNFLRNLWRDGALFGQTEEEAFVVVADQTNNPPEELEEGRVHVQLGVKLSPTAEQIFINIDNVPLADDLSVLQN